MKRKPRKPWKMSVDEMADATKEFDKLVPLRKTRPLTKAERALFEKMRTGPYVSVHLKRGVDRMDDEQRRLFLS